MRHHKFEWKFKLFFEETWWQNRPNLTNKMPKARDKSLYLVLNMPWKELNVFKTEIKRHLAKCQRRVAFFVDFLMLGGIPFEQISVNANCTNRNFVMYGHYFHYIVRRKITVMTWWLSMSHSSVSVYYAFSALQNEHKKYRTLKKWWKTELLIEMSVCLSITRMGSYF